MSGIVAVKQNGHDLDALQPLLNERGVFIPISLKTDRPVHQCSIDTLVLEQSQVVKANGWRHQDGEGRVLDNAE